MWCRRCWCYSLSLPISCWKSFWIDKSVRKSRLAKNIDFIFEVRIRINTTILSFFSYLIQHRLIRHWQLISMLKSINWQLRAQNNCIYIHSIRHVISILDLIMCKFKTHYNFMFSLRMVPFNVYTIIYFHSVRIHCIVAWTRDRAVTLAI